MPFQLRLGNLRSSRATLARVIREYGKGGIDRNVFKDLVYAISVLVGVMKTERDEALEARLEEIEKALNA